MSLNSIRTVVLLFPNQEWGSSATDDELDDVISQLRPGISFTNNIDADSLQTLSSHNADSSGQIDGFLFVPDLGKSDPCYNVSKEYVPSNVTRQGNLPPTDFTLVALAPWINANCTEAYLAAARKTPTRAFLFYLPDNGTAQPPPVSSPSWGLDDGGAWKSQNPFPVYALPSSVGTEMIHQLSLYSGNMTSVPYGHDISELAGIDPRDYVRMYAEIDLVNNKWPGIWAFLLVVVGVLVFMLGITSASMHLIQRSRRNSLRRRIASGEVNLEALGIKRLTVPQDHIEKLPMFTYCSDSVPPSPELKKIPQTTTVERHESSAGSSSQDNSEDKVEPMPRPSNVDDTVSPPHKYLPYSQPTCAICLDDFVSGTTPIRELPCGHIFHPECIDSFLGNNSSLCPMCKKSVLPIGYCPVNITHGMVRRERNIRALRTRVTVSDEETGEYGPGHKFRTFTARIKRAVTHPGAPTERTSQVPLRPQLVLMTSALPAEVNPHASVLGNELIGPLSPSLSREEIAQRRIHDLTSRQVFAEETEAVTTRQRSKWRQAMAKAFPGFT